MTNYISECPNCHTSFSITEEQLDIAEGMVRCGNCRHIYNAREQILNAESEPKVELPETDEDQWLIDDNFVYDDDDEAAQTTEEEGSEKSSIFDSNAPLYDSESWSSGQSTPLNFDDEVLNFDESSLADDALYKDLEELERAQVGKSSDEWAEDLLKEEDENSPENAAFQDILAQLDTNYKNEDPIIVEESSSSNEADDLAVPPLGTTTFKNTPQLSFKKESSWKKPLLILGTIALALLLPGQYIYHNFDKLSMQQSTRPLLENICQVAGCNLPEQRDLNKIKTTNLVVRNHPEQANSLKVDLILSNTADFEQQFPALTLQFRDLQGNVIAGRTFSPSNYLKGELSQKRLMPIKQSMHLEFAIVDPGENAVNYEIIVSQ